MNKQPPTWLWVSAAVASTILIGILDYLTGNALSFFVFYFLPVSLAAWHAGLRASIGIAGLSAAVWLGADALSGQFPSAPIYAAWNALVRLASFLVIGLTLAKIRRLLDREHGLVEDLQQSLSRVKALESFLPICCQCKKIRDNEGSWQPLEKYISEHSDTRFTHGYCPECARKFISEHGLDEPGARPG